MFETRSLTPANFLHYYIFHTQDKTLVKKDRCTALALSIILGIVTAGLMHLIARITSYDKKLQLSPQANVVSKVGTSTLGIITRKTFPRIFNDTVFKRCQSQQSFEQCVEAHNQSIRDQWKKIKNDPKAVEKMWLACRNELTETELKEVAWMQSKWDPKSKSTEKEFWLSQIELFASSFVPYLARMSMSCGGITVIPVWHKMFGVVSREFHEMARLEKLPISKMLPSKDSEKFVWPDSLREFTNQTGIELKETEYKIFKDFFTQRLKFLNQELQFSERRAVFEGISNLSFQSIGLSLSETNLRSVIATKEEVDALAVEDAKNLSKSEIHGLLKRYQGYCYQATMDSDVSLDNVDQLKLPQLRALSAQKFEEILPLLPKRLILFFDNVSHVSAAFLRTHFDQFFSRSLMLEERESAEIRLKNLTSGQVNHLLDLLDDHQFSLLADDVIENLDISALRTNFERIFPEVKGFPHPTPDSYDKITFKLFDNLVDKFDEHRLTSIDHEILQAMDKRKFSPAQLSFLKSINVPSF